MKNINLIELECRDNIAILRFNRPEVHNAVNGDMMTQWEACLDKIEADTLIRSIIITGTGGRTFCAGGDLGYFSTLNTQKACVKMSNRMQEIINRMCGGSRVVVAAINGQALGGGCEISIACHYRIAASHATFAFRQASNGIITGWGGGKRLFKLVGKSSALRLLLTGERVDAKEALSMGLVDQIVAPEDLLSSVEKFVRKINNNSPESVEAFLMMGNMLDNSNDQHCAEFEADVFPDLFLGEVFQKVLKKYKDN